tara:strand:- start:5372 stop:6217 length:846 start_codon:yes stop_codon:yes gene_type:complete
MDGKLQMSDTLKRDYDSLREEISSRHSTLSKRLGQIAKFALDHPTDMALETIASISKRADVQPSSLIRFSKAFGFSGFSEMQKAFKTRVVEHSASYKERVRSIDITDNNGDNGVEHNLLKQFCNAGIVSLEELCVSIAPEDVEGAVSLLEAAEHIYIMAQGRSFPIATYLVYALNHADCRAHLLDGFGGMLDEQSRLMTGKDVLITITFPPYSPDTAKVVSVASKSGTPIIVITDSELSPVSSAARVYFEVHDAEVHGFRSLNSSMCIAQTLATSIAFRNL